MTTRSGDARLSVRVVAPPGEPLGTVFVPPLIGGSGMQQVGYFRALNRSGYAIATFDYRGHGKSDGRFSVSSSLVDATVVVRDLTAADVPAPLYGLGDCYSAIPLLTAARAVPHAFRAVALVNAVPSLRFVVGPAGVLKNYWFEGGRPRVRNPFDLKGMLAATNALLFPEVDKSREHFGILRYENAHGLRTFWEYLRLDPLAGFRIDVPSVVAYGTSDGILGLGDPRREARYRELWTRVLPRAEFQALADIDHFFSETLDSASEVPREFFGRLAAETRAEEATGELRTVTVTPAASRNERASSVA